MSYVLKNFAWGELASDLTDVGTQIVLASGNNLPTLGSFVVVVWDMESYPNPADDPNTEIMIAEYSGSDQVFNVIRAQESTMAVAHLSGHQVALHLTAGLLSNERFLLGTKTVDELSIGDAKCLVVSGVNLVYGGHDDLSGFVLSEHIDHTSVTITGGGILSGGGDISANRCITLSNSDVDHDQTTNFVPNEHIDHTSITITAGTGLTGGGDISTNRTFAVDGVLEDFDTLGAASADGEFIVATGAGAFAYESGATVRTSLGLGTGDSPTFTALTLYDTTGAAGLDLRSDTGFLMRANNSNVLRWSLLPYTTALKNGITSAVISYAGVVGGASWPFDSYGAVVVQGRSDNSSSHGGFAVAPSDSTVGVQLAMRPSGKCGFGGELDPQEDIHANDTIRADTAFNLNGTDGITVSDTVITAL